MIILIYKVLIHNNKGGTALLKSRYEIALKDFRGQQILQPDAMIQQIMRGKEWQFYAHHPGLNKSICEGRTEGIENSA